MRAVPGVTSLPVARLLIAATGSIACAQLPEYIRALKTRVAREVQVMLTASAAEMIAPRHLELFTDGPVHTGTWGSYPVLAPHIKLTRWAQLMLVLPATANIIGKAACGIADDLVSTAILTSEGPILFAPAMNPTMWSSPAVRRNIERLREDGHHVIEPVEGLSVTTGEFGVGLGPTVDKVLAHTLHIAFKRLKEEYYAEATAEAPRSPSSAPVLPVPRPPARDTA